MRVASLIILGLSACSATTTKDAGRAFSHTELGRGKTQLRGVFAPTIQPDYSKTAQQNTGVAPEIIVGGEVFKETQLMPFSDTNPPHILSSTAPLNQNVKKIEPQDDKEIDTKPIEAANCQSENAAPDALLCSGHGVCEQSEDSEDLSCKCDGEWEGRVCDVILCPNECSGHGTCGPLLENTHRIQPKHSDDPQSSDKIEFTEEEDDNGDDDLVSLLAIREEGDKIKVCNCLKGWTGDACETKLPEPATFCLAIHLGDGDADDASEMPVVTQARESDILDSVANDEAFKNEMWLSISDFTGIPKNQIKILSVSTSSSDEAEKIQTNSQAPANLAPTTALLQQGASKSHNHRARAVPVPIEKRGQAVMKIEVITYGPKEMGLVQNSIMGANGVDILNKVLPTLMKNHGWSQTEAGENGVTSFSIQNSDVSLKLPVQPVVPAVDMNGFPTVEQASDLTTGAQQPAVPQQPVVPQQPAVPQQSIVPQQPIVPPAVESTLPPATAAEKAQVADATPTTTPIVAPPQPGAAPLATTVAANPAATVQVPVATPEAPQAATATAAIPPPATPLATTVVVNPAATVQVPAATPAAPQAATATAAIPVAAAVAAIPVAAAPVAATPVTATQQDVCPVPCPLPATCEGGICYAKNEISASIDGASGPFSRGHQQLRWIMLTFMVSFGFMWASPAIAKKCTRKRDHYSMWHR